MAELIDSSTLRTWYAPWKGVQRFSLGISMGETDMYARATFTGELVFSFRERL
jgi:hypothetical protein